MLRYHIQTIEVGPGGASSFEFNGIPQNYDDLFLVLSARLSSDVNESIFLGLNGSTSNFSVRYLQGNGSSVYTGTLTNWIGSATDSGWTSGVFCNTELHLSGYSGNQYKAYSINSVNENNATGTYLDTASGLWSNTSPVTSLQLTAGAAFAQYSSASLYGIKRGSSGQVEVASGGTITTSGGYTYHTFTSSGTFVANRSLQVEALVVAGGGGSGYNSTAGAGAGGLLSSSSTLASGAYLVTIGAGGAGSTTPASVQNGNNSVFASLVAIGGGRGGNRGFYPGGDGGSSGGGASATGATSLPGTPVIGQGYSGGTGLDGGNYNAGGGGGAGGAGGNATSGSAGVGGIGTNAYSSWATATSTGHSGYYSGGGGGGSNSSSSAPGGLGGGGTGTNMGSTPTSGLPNTGGGAGGTGANTVTPASGGSGIVIIRYLTPA